MPFGRTELRQLIRSICLPAGLSWDGVKALFALGRTELGWVDKLYLPPGRTELGWVDKLYLPPGRTELGRVNKLYLPSGRLELLARVGCIKKQ